MSRALIGLNLLTLLVLNSAHAITIFVDQATGDDFNDGLTPGTAVATITQGNALLGDGDTLSIGPGVYSNASGEAYPQSFNGNVSLIGAGADQTILDGTSSGQLLSFSGGNVIIAISDLAVINGSAAIGGGVQVSDADSVDLSGCRFENNVGTIGGGIIIFDTPVITVDDCDFNNNDADIGGAIQVQINTDIDVLMTVTDSDFDSNGTGLGSAIQFQENGLGVHTLNIDRSRFLGSGNLVVNYQANDGTSVGQISNTLFANNTGTALFANSTQMNLVNATFADNATALNGSADTTVVNSIFWDNTTEISGSGGEISFSIIEGLMIGGFADMGNNIDMDPLLNSQYRLIADSPAVDQGSDMAAINLGLIEDLDQDDRLFDFLGLNRPEGVIDIGADELTNLFVDGFE